MGKQQDSAKCVGEDLLHYMAALLFEELPEATQRAIMLVTKRFLAEFRSRVTKVHANNVEGLQQLPSLTSLKLYLRYEDGLSGLTSLSSLRLLDLSAGWGVTGQEGELDLSPVSTLTLLESLRVDASDHMDVFAIDYDNTLQATMEPLAALTNLVSLAILGCYVCTLGPVAGLTRLTALEVQLDTYKGSVDELSLVTSLCQLKSITLHGTAFGSDVALAPLTSMTTLTSLNLSLMQEIDLAPIAHMQLRKLTISGTLAEGGDDLDLEPVGACATLETIDLSCSPLSDVAPLAALSNLKSLDINSTTVADVSPLAACSRLVHLDVAFTDVTDLGPLAGLTNLKVVGFGVSDI